MSENLWVEGELAREMLSTAQGTQYLSLLLIPVMIGVLYGDVQPQSLTLWSAAALVVALQRLGMMRAYRNDVAHAGTAAQIDFISKHAYSWPLSAFVWGLSGFLHFDRAPLTDQFVCWLIMAGLGMFSINGFSTQIKLLKAYINTMGLTLLAVMLWRMGVELNFNVPAYHYWLLLLVLGYWQLLVQAGWRMHRTHRRNFELQYRNTQLIESLTRQTKAALDAVDIKNRFLASAAHDIRQPVHALGLYADWLGSEPELVNEIAPKIVESTKAVNALFDSLFDLVRLDSGKVKINVEEVDLDKLLRDLDLQYRPLALARGLDFRLRTTPGKVETDPILLQRILGNLLANAIKYTERGGVLLAARRSGSRMYIEVWDTGIGIALNHQPEIFREFFKVSAHGGTEDGFGLGLAIVSRLSDILGHRINMVSRPGRGSLFRLQLGTTDAALASARAETSVAQLVNRP
ncbi:MAG: HAMP domain-containing sensor histidine kinase [Burkholderiaceae bacterium]|nr:HAMP domain-containing sensor histidine kinase [Burkholderiaceae bacterium]MDP1968330.1 HAMP domain-containing sensor histidine kinase [Burkholderiaceae bacterium]